MKQHNYEGKDLIIIGSSGHGKVVADLAMCNNYNILGFLDDNEELKEIMGIKIIGKIEDILKYREQAAFVIAIGSNEVRKKLSQEFDVKWCTLIHPTAVVAKYVEIGEGTVVMANTVINPLAKIGKHCIVNTGAIVEHDNLVDDYVHLSPRCVMGGNIRVGKACHVGVGATVKNNVSICSNVVIGAGGVVVKDIEEIGTYVGVPVKRIS